MKKLFRYPLFCLLLLSLFMSSCSDDDGDSISTEFCPLTVDSYWTYESEDFLGNMYEFTGTVLDETKEVNDQLFRKVGFSSGGELWYSYDGSFCSENGNSDILGQNYVWPFFHPTADVGFTWTYDYIYGSTPNRYEMEIIEKGATVEMNNITFNDVTTVERRHMIRDPQTGIWENSFISGVILTRFAAGIGKISSGSSFGDNALVDYQIAE